MAVTIAFGTGAWTRDDEVVKTMMHVAKVPRVLEVYQSLEPRHQEIFQNVLSDTKVWTIKEIIDSTKPKPLPPVKIVTNLAPMPVGKSKHCSSDGAFGAWVCSVADLVQEYNTELAFVIGAASWLKGGNTVKVPIHITHNGTTRHNTKFVLHYHPDAKKASVGSAGASRYHFKPHDHGSIRCKDYDVTNSKRAGRLMRDARDVARAFV